VGFISRIDPFSTLTRNELRATIYTDESSCGNLPNPSYESGVSKHFISRFNVAGLGRISIIGLHFLAFPTTADRCIRREAQASVIRSIAQIERNAGYEPVILGDFNDYDSDILDASNSVPTSRVFEFLKYSGSSKIMYNVVEKVTVRSQRYSSWWDKDNNCILAPGELTLIDHMLVSPSLWSRISGVTIYNQVIQECESLHSDHYPIKATFYTNAALDTEDTMEESTVGGTQVLDAMETTESKDEVSTPKEEGSGLSVGMSVTIGVGVVLTVTIIAIVVIVKRRKEEIVTSSYGTFTEK